MTAASKTRSARAAPSKSRRIDWRAEAAKLPGARERPLAPGFKPELCIQKKTPPTGDDWLHETKWDGYRLLVDLDNGSAHLRSRNDLDWSQDFPEVAAAIESLPVDSARFDGELVALDRRGDSDFGGLQRARKTDGTAALRYVIFDMPALAGVDLRRVPLIERKRLLERVLASVRTDALAYSAHTVGDGERAYVDAGKRGLEGIVSKAIDSIYESRRSPNWIKIKHANSDEFIVVGYTAPKGARQGFGSLLMATVEKTGALRYVGRVGTGFDDALLTALTKRFAKMRRDAPVVALPAHVPFRANAVHWVKPELVAEVQFRGWAKEGLLRQASFARLREDKGTEDLGMAASEESVTITHPERVVYPGTKVTKGRVAEYYRAVADWLLPELAERPLSVIRCPRGIGSACFFQKHPSESFGPHVHSIPIIEKAGTKADYLYVSDIEGVLELVQMNVLELHPWGSRVDDADQPDRLIFDLDPSSGIDWATLIGAAREIRKRLAAQGLESFVKLSGGKGVHVVAPIARGPNWDQVKSYCETFAEALQADRPDLYISTASKAKRRGLIFVDWLRNARGQTSVVGWSLRARKGAPVAMPIKWEELGKVAGPAAFDLAAATKRAATLRKDPWQGIDTLTQSLPGARESRRPARRSR